MKNNKGFIGKIILIVVALIALKYFLNFDIIDWIITDVFNFFSNIFGHWGSILTR